MDLRHSPTRIASLSWEWSCDPAILRSCDPPTRYAQTWLAVAINRLAPSCIIVSNFAVEGAATAETPTDSDWIRSNAIKPKWVIVSITRFQHGICCTNHFFDFIAFCLLLFTSQQPQQKPKKQKQKQKQKHEGMIVVFTLLATRWWIGSQDNKKKPKKKKQRPTKHTTARKPTEIQIEIRRETAPLVCIIHSSSWLILKPAA